MWENWDSSLHKIARRGTQGTSLSLLHILSFGFLESYLEHTPPLMWEVKERSSGQNSGLRASEKTTLDQKQNNCAPSTSCSSVGSQPAMHLHLPVSQMIEKKHRNLQLTVWMPHPDLLMFFLYLFAVCLLMCVCFLSNSQHAPSLLGSENRCIRFFLGRLSSISPIS